MAMTDQERKAHVAALRREHRGYVIRGERERAEQVAEQIRLNGGEEPSTGAPARQTRPRRAQETR